MQLMTMVLLMMLIPSHILEKFIEFVLHQNNSAVQLDSKLFRRLLSST